MVAPGLFGAIRDDIFDAQSLRSVQDAFGRQREISIDQAALFCPPYFGRTAKVAETRSLKEELQHETDQWLKDVDL
jgi:hypothetical protein